MDQQTKNFLKSKTLWGAVVAGLAGLSKSFGFELGNAEITQMTEALVILAGVGLAIYGRFNADTKLTKGKGE